MQIGSRRSIGWNWNRQQSSWHEMQQQRERSAARREVFERQNAMLNNMLQTAAADQVFGLGELAAQSALKRIQEEAAAKAQENQRRAEAEATRELIWRNREPPMQVDAGDARVDFASDTLTLADGTRIDLTTGQPVQGNTMKLADGTTLNLDTGKVTGSVDVKA